MADASSRRPAGASGAVAPRALPQTQAERLRWLVDWLLADDPRWTGVEVPADTDGLWQLYRSLVNVRDPRPVSAAYLQVEDALLAERRDARGVTRAEDLPAVGPNDPKISLWQGDITCLAADAIVNAANSQMLGCFAPCHGCIDNAIHTSAGVRLRAAMAELMAAQRAPEPTGRAKMTRGFNLPAAHVLHTVGPIVAGRRPRPQDARLLTSCYVSCLDAARAAGLTSVAFCCISTGEFGYPPADAARVAVGTVRAWLASHPDSQMKVIFDVFSHADLCLYQELL